ncbi:hypothetical protein HPP92_018151 [Vanilla planifolia]|uniref:UBC core domain-containing protein n=1 Tax=Vanilla planifolia TaxID=51239 RepID=A0A835UP50_VANPL|nr:hypothetical protein HPP92_018151 [Vanilla planifolia]
MEEAMTKITNSVVVEVIENFEMQDLLLSKYVYHPSQVHYQYDPDNINNWPWKAIASTIDHYRTTLIHHGCDGGYFNAIMSFPQNYPNSPPTVRFTSEMWHPNVYPDGRVCISILHAPGEDPTGYELASERWTPVHTVESIVLSIISMLSSRNDESPANVEAAKEWRDRMDDFKKKVRRIVRRSQEML